MLWASSAPALGPRGGKSPAGCKWCIFKSETGQSTVTAAGCRQQTPDRFQEKEKPRLPESLWADSSNLHMRLLDTKYYCTFPAELVQQ